jgi:hypothetical protein
MFRPTEWSSSGHNKNVTGEMLHFYFIVSNTHNVMHAVKISDVIAN